MLLKASISIIVFVAVIVTAGVSGVLFKIWPTTWSDEDLRISEPMLDQLRRLREKPKFLPEPKQFYPGARNEEMRLALEELMNALIDYLIHGVQKHPKKSFVLATFKEFLGKASRLDSEERDRILRYFGEIMTIVGIKSSNELFNVWRYGFPYGWVIR